MSSFDVTAVDLQVTGAALNQISADSQAGLARLTSDVESLLGGSWSGSAAAAFRTGWQSWHAAASDALSVLSEMGSLLSVNGRQYTESDVTGQVRLSEPGQML